MDNRKDVGDIGDYLKSFVFQAPQVLAIDRDEDNLVLVYQTLEMFGYTCVVTQDCKIAFNLARIYQPNLILLAISATRGEDLELLDSLKKNPQTANLPIIALTTFTDSKECERLLDMGCKNYLCKPYLIEELGTLVTRYIPLGSANSYRMESFSHLSGGIV
jgi:two-component system, cell cycle response regulator DivK